MKKTCVLYSKVVFGSKYLIYNYKTSRNNYELFNFFFLFFMHIIVYNRDISKKMILLMQNCIYKYIKKV